MSVVAERVQRPGGWMEAPGLGVYVHIPFCLHRCHYCDFNTYANQEGLHGAYVDALIQEINRPRPELGPATSVFFGGGTPTLLAPSALEDILAAIEGSVGIAPCAEVTAEANPETVDASVFEGLLHAGFNRFSIGVQSLAPRVLSGLGRTHSPEVALEALAAARQAGAGNLNADVIYGSSWEEPGDWAATLRGVVEASPEHVSAYALTVEEGTPLATLVAGGRVPDVDPDVQAERFAVAEERLSAAGYRRYEISSWARPGAESRHNLLYWSAGDYLGFGAGAHGHIAGTRSWSVRLPREFIAAVSAGRSTEAGREALSVDERAGEALMLGLRLSSGIDLPGFERRFGAEALRARHDALESLLDRGLLERRGPTLRLEGRATLVANDVLCRLL
jgi:putative oxygen-independent coproporphyrinogen III oxidase